MIPKCANHFWGADMGRTFLAAALFASMGAGVSAGGFACEMTYECKGNMGCDEVSYSPYIDTDWGQISMKHYGPEMQMAVLPSGRDGDTWHLYAHLPEDGLFVVVINDDDSAVFTSYLRQGGSAHVVSVYGRCESRG